MTKVHILPQYRNKLVIFLIVWWIGWFEGVLYIIDGIKMFVTFGYAKNDLIVIWWEKLLRNSFRKDTVGKIIRTFMKKGDD